jgi:hypothetical protein
MLCLLFIAYRRRDGHYLLYITIPSMHIVAAIALVLLPVYAYTCICVFELVVAAMLPFVVIVVSAFLCVELIVAASLLILPCCFLAVRIVADSITCMLMQIHLT